jgi:hypothetical protein
MHQDRYGLPVTTASDAAAAAYRDGVDRLLAAWTGAESALETARQEDPEFALAHAARARLHQLYGEAAPARAAAARARELAVHATARERRHVEIIAASVEGQPAAAIAGAEAHLDEYPRDALILSLLLGAYGLYAFSGRPDHNTARVAICERHARHYGDDWWFLTYLGWSHTEAGNVGAGRMVTERALERRRENAHAAHALAHACFEQGDAEQGCAFIAGWLPNYDKAGLMNGHISWHSALLALEADDVDGALQIYEQRIRPPASHAPPLSVFVDGASLLWRIALRDGRPLDPHWRELAAYGAKVFPKAGAHFVDMHYALVGAALGSAEALERRVSELEALQAAGKLAPGAAALDLCGGIRAFAAGDYAQAIRILEPLMPEVVRIGGSGAQRELYEDTLVVAYLRAGRGEAAAGLIDRRLHRRPSARDQAWRRQAGTAALQRAG